MTETTTQPASAAKDADVRGLPYYEKLKRDLRETLQKKRALDKSLASIEDQIYRQETQYLEDTSAGNIIKGFDNYIKGSNAGSTLTPSGGGGGTSTRRKSMLTDNDRIFSKSSVGSARDPSPEAGGTPSHAATPTSHDGKESKSARDSGHATPTTSGPKTAGLKRSKKAAAVDKDDDDNDGKAPKRLKITYARGDKSAD